MPPGHHTWNWFRRCTFRSGYNVATSGLHTASINPLPSEMTSAPMNSDQNPVAVIMISTPST